jgi:membrane-associated phospholipid phosphatase
LNTAQANTIKRYSYRPEDLQSPGTLSRHLGIGWVLFALGGIVFLLVGYNLEVNGPLLQWDLPLANQIHALALRSALSVRDFMFGGYYTGQQVLTLLGIFGILYFLSRHYWRELAMVIIGCGGETPIWFALAYSVDRHRPVFAVPFWAGLKSPGFPSGHSMSALICFGFLAYLLVPKMPTRFWKGFVIVIAVLLTLYVGVSRLFMGDHYLSDVIAGYALGLAWAVFSFTAIELLFQRKTRKVR